MEASTLNNKIQSVIIQTTQYHFSGLIIDIKSVNTPLHDYELFDDAPFWHLPDDVADAYKPARSRNDSKFEMNVEKPIDDPSVIDSHVMIVNKVYPE